MVMNVISAMKKTEQQLHESGFELAPQREATLLVLLGNEREHLSAEEIFFLVKKKNPEIGFATVYRTLEVLTGLKIVDKVGLSDGLAHYDLRKEGAKHFHHHLLCLNCGTIEEVEEDLLPEVERVIGEHYHLLVKGHRLTSRGICQECYEKEKGNQSV